MEIISNKLISFLKNTKTVFIQTHDFPDPDAIASAFGLQYLLKEKSIESRILYSGELQTNPVEKMIKDLNISMNHINEITVLAEDKIIIVDGCKGNGNITNQLGEIIAVIDHHEGQKPGDIPFADIRTNCGSCATIISLYLKEQNINPVPDVATALAIGIHVDTNSFKRRTSFQDLKMFSFLYNKINHKLLGSILRNNVFQEELIVYEEALKAVKIDKKFAFYHYPNECSQNLLGIIADFFLAIEEVEFVVLCAHSNNKIIFSVRSENPDWNTASIIRKALKDLGSGGGHKDMAGGIIKDVSLFNEKDIYQRFKSQLNI